MGPKCEALGHRSGGVLMMSTLEGGDGGREVRETEEGARVREMGRTRVSHHLVFY